MLILSVPKYFDELLQYCGLAPITPLRELCRIVIVAIYLALMFVVAVLSAEYCRTDRAGEMFDVVFTI